MDRTTSTAASRVVLIDDHPVVREGIRSFLELDPLMLIVGEFDHPLSALAALRSCRPDVILLDLHFGATTSLPKLPLIRREAPQAAILMVSCDCDPTLVDDLLRAGVDGYLSKDSPPSLYLEAISAVLGGKRFVAPDLLSRLKKRELENPFKNLPPQQRKYAELAASGLSVAEIAEVMRIEPSTVASHRKEVLSRLGLSDSDGLAKLGGR